MRLKSSFLICILFCLFTCTANLYSQKVTTILLDKKIHHPLLTYDPKAQSALMGTQETSLSDKFLAGDYSDSITKFRLVVLPPDMESLPADRTYMFYVTPYTCDSVYIGSQSMSSTDMFKSPVIGVGKRKFKATVSPDGKSIQLIDVSDKPVLPDARLYENKLPAGKFALLYGGTQSFTSLENQHKLIYIYFWRATDCTHCLNDLDTLKEVYNVYKNNVSIISLFYPEASSNNIDTIGIKKIRTDKKLEWIQGFCDLELAGEFFVNNSEHGMLFDENGNMLKMYLLPGELKALLKKKYGK